MAKIKHLRVASDKSISHRAIIISSLAEGETKVNNILLSLDTQKSLKAMSVLGVGFENHGNTLIVEGKGKYSFKEPDNIIDMGNSGTSARLISGVLAANEFVSFVTGDASLRKRPMERIIKPLSMMGAQFLARDNNYLPIAIRGRHPSGIDYFSSIPSAQVKSSILLAGLYTNDKIKVTEPLKSRNHTENMLKAFGVDVIEGENWVELGRNRQLIANLEIDVPADISSAAFFMVYTAIKKNFELILTDVNLNPTRTGIFEVFKQANVDYEIINERTSNFEKIGDVVVKSSRNLKPFKINKDLIPFLIDEIPVLSILAVFCDGVSEVKDAQELRKKESDRIKAICKNLNRIGVKTEEFEDGFKVYGSKLPRLKSAEIDTYLDHRIAMSFLVLREATGINVKIKGTQSILVSYPNFTEHINYISF